ncbi:MAG: hypothetical protein ABIQ18_35860, partial [Umezawaea sp.]
MDRPPLFVEGADFNADPVRRSLSGFLGDIGGWFGVNDFASTLNPDFTVTVQPGRASLPTPDQQFSGVFLVESLAAVTLTIDPPHATQNRIDRLIAYAVPPVNATDTGRWCLELRKGTPSATPTGPTVAGALLLREFTVYAESKARPIESFDYRFSAGQQLISGANLYGLSRPVSARPGTLWTNSATKVSEIFTGTSWDRVTPLPPSVPAAVQVHVPGGFAMSNQQNVQWAAATNDARGMWGGPSNPTRVV